MKFVSERVRPGFVEVLRICEMRIGRPVRVERSRREVRWRWPVNWRSFWCVSESDILAVGAGRFVRWWWIWSFEVLAMGTFLVETRR